MVEALSSDRYLALLDRLDSVSKPALTGDESPLADRWRKEWKRADKLISALDDDSSDPELHEGRIQLKKARYAAELAAHELGKQGRALREGGVEAPGRPGRAPGRRRRGGPDRGMGSRRERRHRSGAAGRASARPPPESARNAPESLEEGAPRREADRVSVVRAAGGVPVRDGAGGIEVLVVHRDRYDDWSFPKGKCDPDETDEACAIREVEEETGLRCRLEDELPSTEYVDARGRPKRVRYWRLDIVGGELAFDHEVDEAKWVSVAEAEKLLSYERDLAVLHALGTAGSG